MSNGMDRQIAMERLELMDLMDRGDYAIPSRRIDENLLIATWNIQHLSNNKENRALQYMADILERFDLIALQEVKTNMKGLIKLKDLLPGNYKIFVTDPTGNYERFVFLYDKRTVYPTGLVCEVGFNVTAKDHQGYQLHRMPYCASFRAGRFDFVIVNTHIYYGSTTEQREHRRKEIEELAKYVIYRATRDEYKVFDKDFFIVGDFNIEEEGDQFFNALMGNGFEIPPVLNHLTTNFNRTKTFDKIAWYPNKNDQFCFSGRCNVVPFYKAVYQDTDPKGGKKQISDHLPLWAEFNINELNQELNSILK